MDHPAAKAGDTNKKDRLETLFLQGVIKEPSGNWQKERNGAKIAKLLEVRNFLSVFSNGTECGALRRLRRINGLSVRTDESER
jgi:hypothetical protein